MDMITLAKTKPKKIDLSKYGGTLLDNGEPVEAVNLNLAILALFSQGGGSRVVADTENFWKDVTTDKPVRFFMYASDDSDGLTVEAGARSVFTNSDGIPISIDFTFAMMGGDMGGANATATAIFINDYYNDKTTITVVVEPLTIPGV